MFSDCKKEKHNNNKTNQIKEPYEYRKNEAKYTKNTSTHQGEMINETKIWGGQIMLMVMDWHRCIVRLTAGDIRIFDYCNRHIN